MSLTEQNGQLLAKFAKSMKSLEHKLYCSHIWLGHGHALFTQFSRNEFPVESKFSHGSGLIEFHTHFSTWRILHHSLEVSHQESNINDNLIGKFIDKKLIEMKFDLTNSTISFHVEEDWVIGIVPWALSELDEESKSSDAWAFRIHNNYYGVSCSGVVNMQSLSDRIKT